MVDNSEFTKSVSVASYIADAKAVSRYFPVFRKYARRKTLKPAEKAAITRAAKRVLAGDTKPRKRKGAHDETYYREAIKKVTQYDKDYRKYKGRKKLKPSEKAAITRRYRKVGFIASKNFIPLSREQFKKLPRAARADKKIMGVMLRSAPDAKVMVRKDGSLFVTSNNRKWIYEPLPVRQTLLDQGGEDGLHSEKTEALIDLFLDAGRIAFDEKNARQVHLWVSMGRSAEGFANYKSWEQFIIAWFMRGGSPKDKKNPDAGIDELEDWLVGIAYLIP